MPDEPTDAPVPPEDVLDEVKRRVKALDVADEGRVREGPFGEPMFVIRRDLDHLDADALNDRLHAWIQREVHPNGFEAASAFVSFDHAVPAEPGTTEDPDYQERWHNIEAVFRLDVDELQPATAAHLDAWVRLVPAFVRTVGRDGRPEGFRDVWEGAAE